METGKDSPDFNFEQAITDAAMELYDQELPSPPEHIEVQAASSETPFEEVGSTTPEAEPSDKMMASPEAQRANLTINSVNSILERYNARQRDVKTIRKQGKRKHQEKMIARDCVRELNEGVGEELSTGYKHILGKPGVLGALLEESNGRNSVFFTELSQRSSEAARQHSFSIVQNPVLFADIIKASVREELSDAPREVLDRIISTILNEASRSSVIRVVECVAGAALEMVGDEPAIKKILGIAYLDNDLVTHKSSYVTRSKADMAEEMIKDGVRGTAIRAQSDAVFLQLDKAYLGNHKTRGDISSFVNHEELRRLLVNRGISIEVFREHDEKLKEFDDYSKDPLHYDPVVVDHMEGGSHQTGRKEIPEALAEVLDAVPLYKKRMRELAPRAYAREVGHRLLTTMGLLSNMEILAGDFDTYAVDTLISPGQAISEIGFAHPQMTDDVVVARTLEMEDFLEQIIENGRKPSYIPLELQYGVVKGEDAQNERVYFHRPAVTADRQDSEQVNALALPFYKLLGRERISQANWEQDRQELAETYARIQTEGNRSPGRRPIHFALPEKWSSVGLKGLDVRQDEYGFVNATFRHEEGDIELLLAPNLETIDRGRGNKSFSRCVLFAEKIISTLLAEWACRPAINTSEGVVSEEEGDKVNFGHWAYLPVVNGKPHNFSERQAYYHTQEQGHLGLTLAEKSELRKQDPRSVDPATGIRRNSTYYRESYDPSKPPLEVYYDHSILD